MPDTLTAPMLYTADDLAELLRCSTRSVWRLSYRNLIPGRIRVGRLLRFSKAAVDAWLVGGKGACA
jgi:excisionase family DNA binding protein